MAPKKFSDLLERTRSARQMNAAWVNVFGGGLTSLMPLGGAAFVPPRLDPQALAQQCFKNALRGQSAFEMFAQQMANMRSFPVAPRRPKRPWGYWQFKNGKTEPLPENMYAMDMTVARYRSWDRSLGAFVYYAR
jgi:hypothetical protein